MLDPSAGAVLQAWYDAPWIQNTMQAARDFLPALLAALAILIVGYLIALLAAALVRRALHRTDVDDRLMRSIGRPGKKGTSERTAGAVVFWAIMAFVFLGALQALRLGAIGEPLSVFLNDTFAFLPNLIGAVALGVLAWGIATVVKRASLAGLEATHFDERVGRSAGEDPMPLSKNVSTGLYWLVILLFVPAILGALQLQSLVEPVNALVVEVMDFVPNLVGAAAILLIGWFVARVVRIGSTNLLQAAGLDRLGERTGVQEAMGDQTPSKLVGLFLYILILLPVAVAALDTLGIDAVTAPAQGALDEVVGIIPDLAAAAAIVAIAYLVGRVVAGLVTGLLAGIGVDRVWSAIGVSEPERAPRVSRAIGITLGAAIVVLASIEAASLLGFDLVATLASDLVVFAGRVALGLVILVAGLWLGKAARSAVRMTNVRNAEVMGTLAQGGIIVLATGMALQEIGLANELVLLTFGLVLGATAVAGAIAFGLGGRTVAEEQLRDWRAEAGYAQSTSSRSRPGGQTPPTVAGGEGEETGEGAEA